MENNDMSTVVLDLDKLEALARTPMQAATAVKAEQALSDFHDEATPATVLQLIALARRAPAPADDRITKLREALRQISETRFGWEGDCGVTRIADDALHADDETAAHQAAPASAPADAREILKGAVIPLDWRVVAGQLEAIAEKDRSPEVKRGAEIIRYVCEQHLRVKEAILAHQGAPAQPANDDDRPILERSREALDYCIKALDSLGVAENSRKFALKNAREVINYIDSIAPAQLSAAPSIDTPQYRNLLFCYLNASLSSGAREKAKGALTAYIDAEIKRLAAAPTSDQQAGAVAALVPLSRELPSPDDHDRVLVYTDGVDFAGEQYFDIKTEDLWEVGPENRTEVVEAATHWMPLPMPGAAPAAIKQAGAPDAKDRHIESLKLLVQAYGPKSLQYDIEHPNDGLNGDVEQAGAQPVAQADIQVMRDLAYRTLWLAFVWNDHNFDAAHKEARATCQNLGIKTMSAANEWLEKINRLAAPTPATDQSQAARDVLAERQRQKEVEGWNTNHDDGHDGGEMAVAAGYYALSCGYPHERDIGRGAVPTYWPWAPSWWKPKDRRSNLVRAGALIIAEIERIDRAATPVTDQPKQEDQQ